ncbi:MAG: hypothetical protein KDK70_03905 [Myxococcales bacterium]|nr:hypothetical protein [Myxococcales bacterium]
MSPRPWPAPSSMPLGTLLILTVTAILQQGCSGGAFDLPDASPAQTLGSDDGSEPADPPSRTGTSGSDTDGSSTDGADSSGDEDGSESGETSSGVDDGGSSTGEGVEPIPGVVIVGPAAYERTILPDCVDGLEFVEFAPPCWLNSPGVSFDELFAIEYHFEQDIGPITGDFFMDETGGGGYDIALSTIPGDMNPELDGCKSLYGGFAQLRYYDQEAAANAVPGPGPQDPLYGVCVVDKTKTYYFNVHVVDDRCDALDPEASKCSPIVLQDIANLDL